MPGVAAADCVAGGDTGDRPIALVFSGGGAKGAWEAGVAAALVEAGVPIALAAGSSAGALNAAMVADGRIDRLEATWRALDRDHVYRMRPSVVLSGLLPGWLTALTLGAIDSLLDPAPLRDALASLDLARIRTSPTRVLVVATDVVRREARVFDNETLSVDVLMGATAVPGLFPAVVVAGDPLMDGGLVARAPVLEALAAGAARRALVLVSYATAERGRAPTSVRAALEEAFETAMVHQIRRDGELARLRHPDAEIQFLAPSAPLDLRPLDFDPERLGLAFDRGRADGRACVAAWRR
jgi:predicted acylesterase/phospholipase RssA